MKSILGIGNALTDVLAVLPDYTLLKKYHLPVGSMQHVDMQTSDLIWQDLRQCDIQYVAGGCAANTIAGAALFGMNAGFIGKVGNDELGHLFRSDQERMGIKSTLLTGRHSSGRAMVFISGENGERTFAVYLGSALDLVPEDLYLDMFIGYDYCHIEGYLVQNQALCRRVAKLAHTAGCIVSLDLASYNVVESNSTFLHDLVNSYIDIVFANETESLAYTGLEPRAALDDIAAHCDIAVVKLGSEGSWVKSGDEVIRVQSRPADAVDATGAGDSYAAGFLYAHSLGMPLQVCGEVGSIISAKVVEVVGTKVDVHRWRAAIADIEEVMKAAR